MEIHGLGPCVFIDTAGLDDEGDLGALRIRQTLKAMERTDIALLVCRDEQIGPEMEWAGQLKEKNIPTIWVLNQADKLEDPLATARAIEKKCGQVPLIASALNRQGMDDILRTLVHKLPGCQYGERHCRPSGQRRRHRASRHASGHSGPQRPPDPPSGTDPARTARPEMSGHELHDTNKLPQMLEALARPPKLIITDSQVFGTVYARKPETSRLTPFRSLRPIQGRY